MLWENVNGKLVAEAVFIDGDWRWKKNPLFEKCYDLEDEEGIEHFFWDEMDDW